MVFTHIQDRDQQAVVEAYCRFCVEKVYTNFIRGASSFEVHVEVALEPVPDVVYGTGDLIVIREFNGVRDCCGVDLKTGFHDVTVPENEQFVSYMLGAKRKFNINGKLIAIGFLPRVAARDIPYEKWEIPQDKISYWEEKITSSGLRAIQMYRGEIPVEVNPGGHCEWCPVQCSARLKQIEEQSGVTLLGGDELLSDLTPATVATREIKLPDPESYTPEQLALILRHEDSFKTLFESVHQRAQMLMNTGEKVPGFKLVATETKRRWIKDQEEEIAIKLKERGVQEPWRKQLVTLGQAETLLGKGKINDLVEKPDPSIVVAPETDKRPAYNPAADNKLLTNI